MSFSSVPDFFTRIPIINNGYYISGNYILKLVDKRLTIFQYNENLEESFEDEYCKQLKKEGKSSLIKLRKETKAYRKRCKAKEYKKEIWIINDRQNKAGDNGEFFFRYLREKKPVGVKPFFVINKNCPDYRRLSKFGNILDLNSHKYLNKINP